jgi:Lrp/AsnC family transcriptional regulator for asnA, asnC and gidA
MLTIDNLKEKIIQELTEDGRKSFSAIAKKLGVSPQSIMRRYNEMKADGTIVFSSITVNLEKLGYVGSAHLLIKTKLGASATQTINRLSKTPNIIIATRTIGAYEAYAVLVFRDVKELCENVSRIRELPDVLTVDLSFAMPGVQNFPPKTGFARPPKNRDNH